MTFGKSVMCQKDTGKGSAVHNYRPISCLSLMCKIMAGMLAEKIYCHLERENVLQSEQKDAVKGVVEQKTNLIKRC